MNRRQALQTGIGMVASWFLSFQKPLPRIDMHSFCGFEGSSIRYELDKPFEQESFAWATDGKIIIRTGQLSDAVRVGDSLPLPPAMKLPYWNNDVWNKGGWVKLTNPKPVLWRGGPCPKCMPFYKGDGWPGRHLNRKGCMRCDSIGYLYDGGACPKCKGEGSIGDVCQYCQGQGYGDFPSAVELDGHRMALSYWNKIAALPDSEIKMFRSQNDYTHYVYRFDGGCGAVMGISDTV